MSDDEPKLPREGITTGTICEYHRLEHKPWVLVTGTPGTIADYTADGWEPEEGAWDDYDDDTELVELTICEYIPDAMFATLEGGDLEDHREVALVVREDADIDGHVGPRPLFNPLGPIAHEYREEVAPADD
jgi:hypothetical protein